MTPTTLKAARAGLGWTQAELAAHAEIHYKSVANAERSNTRPRRISPDNVLPKIEAALARHGVTISGNAVHFHAPPDP